MFKAFNYKILGSAFAASHAGNRGSIPLGATLQNSHNILNLNDFSVFPSYSFLRMKAESRSKNVVKLKSRPFRPGWPFFISPC